MKIRTFASIFGIIFLGVGIAGFIPGISPEHQHPGLAVEASSRLIFGLFPVNAVHNMIHIAFGIWGLAAGRSLGAAKIYAKSVAVIYALLAVMGLVPGLNTTFGLAPIGGADVLLHALLAAVASYFGFFHRELEDHHVAQRPAGAPRNR